MNEIDEQQFAKRLRTMQIINFALVNGVVVFAAIVCFIVFFQRNEPPQQANRWPIVTLIGAAMLVPGAVISFLLPGLMMQSAVRSIAAGTWQIPPGQDAKEFASDGAKLLAARQVAMIISLALLEGPAFVGCIAFFVEGRIYGLVIAGLAAVMMLVRFPTLGSVRAWLHEHLEKVAALRSRAEGG
jgi:hypothetical protein